MELPGSFGGLVLLVFLVDFAFGLALLAFFFALSVVFAFIVARVGLILSHCFLS